jgi:hypothetical protein
VNRIFRTDNALTGGLDKLLEDLRGEITDLVPEEIEAALACTLPRSHQHLTEAERDFIETQIEVVD